MNPFATSTELLILKLLREHGELYGAQLMHLSNNRLKRGSIYITLGRMEEKGLVKRREGEQAAHGGPARPLYSVAKEGGKSLREFELLLTPAPE